MLRALYADTICVHLLNGLVMRVDDPQFFRIMRQLASHPELSQRDLAQELGISLGKVNYCLKALVEKGYVKAQNFRNSRSKAAYLYLLTPAGIEAKSKLTLRFLSRKMQEYEQLRLEIDELKQEAARMDEQRDRES